MKLALVTRSDDSFSEIASLSHPILRKYADRIGADFVSLGKKFDAPNLDKLGSSHYRIFALYDLFNEYERIISMDTDVLISPMCPDLFKLIDKGCIGTVYEDMGSRKDDRRNRIRLVQERWGNVGWSRGYLNTGVFVCSKQHAKIFQTNNGKYWEDLGYDDVHLGWMIHNLKMVVSPLHYSYNHQSMFSEPWNGSPDRLDSFIIHYSGAGKFPGSGWQNCGDWYDPDIREKHRLKIMRKDYDNWYGEKS